MKNCATCRHWMKPEDACYQKQQLGKCTKAKLLYECYAFDSLGNYILDEEFKNNLAFTADASDYHAELLTKAEFGCVQHEVIS